MAPEATQSESESARQVAELAALRRMLMVSKGIFSLSFAVYSTLSLRDDLLETLAADFPGIIMIRLAATGDPLADTQQQLGARKPQALFLLDLETSLEAHASSAIRALNASRELWAAFECPVMFWLAEHAATQVSRQAVDLWRYRSHMFEFSAQPHVTDAWRSESFPGYDMIDGLPFEEKKFRRAELVQRLAQIGDAPAKPMLPHVLDWMFELAKLHEMFGDYDDAETLLRTALQLSEQQYGDEAPETTTALNNLAQLLKATNRLPEAEPLMRRALAMDEQTYGAEHPNVAIDLNNLAQLLQATNRLAEAEPLMRRALAMHEQTYGTEHPDVSRDLNNLAQLLQATNRLSEAEPLMRRALAMHEQTYGSEHPNVATSLNNLAALLQTTNRLSEAEPLMLRALAMDEQTYGTEHPNVARDLNNLAQLLQDTNRLTEAEPLMQRSVQIHLTFTTTTQHEHPNLQPALTNYTNLLKALKFTQAQIDERINAMH